MIRYAAVLLPALVTSARRYYDHTSLLVHSHSFVMVVAVSSKVQVSIFMKFGSDIHYLSVPNVTKY